MARYYFHILNGSLSIDEEGVELSGIADARLMAIRALSEVLQDLAYDNNPNLNWSMNVTNGAATVFSLKVIVEPPEAKDNFAR